MASSKKKQDEKHLKILREMVALSHNKQCFDCHQRGPTYINMTIGSYVCTACSGLLRGLNPPHRVKSISMASFTPEEMDFIKCHGNEFCRKVWLGLYDNRLGNQAESREETKVKDFMSQKYERKRYYVAPTETMKEEAMRMNESAITSKTPGTRPLKALLGDNAPKLHLGNHQEIQKRSSATRASLTIQGDLFVPASGPAGQKTEGNTMAASTSEAQQQDGNLFGSTLEKTEQTGSDLLASTSGFGQSTGENLFGTTTLIEQQSGNDLFASTNDMGQQSAGNNLFASTSDLVQQPAVASGIGQQPDNGLFASASVMGQQSSDNLFSATNGIENRPGDNPFTSTITGVGQMQGDTMFASQSNTGQGSSDNPFGQPSSLGLNQGDNLFASTSNVGATDDLFAGPQPGYPPISTSSIAQSDGGNLFASMGNVAQPVGSNLFASMAGEIQPAAGGNLFASTAGEVQAGAGSLFASTRDVPQPSGITMSTTPSVIPGGDTFGPSFGPSVDAPNPMLSQAAHVPQPNPFGSSEDNLQQSLGGQALFNPADLGTVTTASTGSNDLFGGQTGQGSDLFSGQMSQGQGHLAALGSQGNPAGANPFGAIQVNTQAPGDVLGGETIPTVPSGGTAPSANQGLADMFGSQSTQVLTNSIVQEPKPVSATPPPIGSTPQSPGNQSVQSSKSSGSTAMDLLGDLGGDPFASSGPQTQASTGGFADFGNFGNTGSQSGGFPPVKQATSQPPPFAQSTPLQPFGSSSTTTPTSQALNGSVAPPPGGGDKYSNLSDLFSMATTSEAETTPASTGWTSAAPATGGGLNWNSGGGVSSSSTGGINWGGDSSTNTGAGGLNWNSSSSSQSASNMSVGWGGGGVSANTSNAATTGMGWGTQAPAQSNGLGAPGNPFLQSNVANPFGGGSGTSLTTQGTGGVAGASNPFGGQQTGSQQQFGGGYGTQQGGFGQFGAQQNVAVSSAAPGQFGQFGGMQNGGFGAMTSTGAFGTVPTNTQAGFQQPGQQQFIAPPAYGQQPSAGAGFGAMPQAGFGGQPAQGFGQPAQGYGAQPQQQMQGFPAAGGWGQAPASSSANPFMSTAQQYSAAPKSGTTNPFL